MTQSVKDDLQPPPLTRKIKLVEADDPTDKTIGIDDSERTAIMNLLDLGALDDVEFVYRLRRGGGRRIHLSGRLRASVVQTCVVTLDPVPATIDVPVEAEFWPPEKIAALQEQVDDPAQTGGMDWPEPIEGDAIDLGPLIYETLATSLDPYPKKPGAQFDWAKGQLDERMPQNGPFAALRSLKNS